eukprot:TRINITY_DN4567_c0_g1_i1.p1 TRINITY_DN4567_c0_g1~~TRINITY_DN4567_c0_g1_i1.p1  ORF type:complete len:300 (-),score=41.25 TRINITY_DN4567_c0_g1_i1:106-1005(-)
MVCRRRSVTWLPYLDSQHRKLKGTEMFSETSSPSLYRTNGFDSTLGFTTSNSWNKRYNPNYGEYEQICSPKEGAPDVVTFVQKLRILKQQNQRLPPTKPFSFYNEDLKKWRQRVSINNSKTVEAKLKKGLEVGPRSKTVYDLIDVDTKGNTGTIEHLISPKSERSLISFAFLLRNYKGGRVKIAAVKNLLMGTAVASKGKQHKRLESCFEKWERRHPPAKCVSSVLWNSEVSCSRPLESNTQFLEKFNDKFADRNIANYNMHFGPKNGKEQIEWQCQLRSYPRTAPHKSFRKLHFHQHY